MKKNKILLIFFYYIFFWSHHLKANPKISPYLVEGDKLFSERSEMKNAYLALSNYQAFLDKNAHAPEGLWRASMANYYIGHLIEPKKKKIAYYKNGIQQGKDCVEYSQGKRVECYFWLGTNYALLKKEYGSLSMVFGIGKLFDYFEKAMELDPKYAGSGPHRMLALLYYKVPGFLGGNNRKAYSHIKKAIEFSPNEPLNYDLYLKFLIDDHKEKEAHGIALKFVAQAQIDKFEFFESKTAFQKIVNFTKNKTLEEN